MMSEHPYKYGPYQGQQSQSQSRLPYTQLPSINSQSPYYGAFQQPTHIPTHGNYATVNNSFQHNASTIPGLGMSNPLVPNPSRLESNSTRNSQPQGLQQHVSTRTSEQSLAITSKQGNIHEKAMNQLATTTATSSQVQADQALEEGELSEGEFDDLYEPQETVDIAMPAPPSKPPSAMGNQNGSVGDADGSSIYDGATPRGEVITNSTTTSLPAAEQDYSPGEEWEPTYEERERSGSYSPYLSPREIQRKVSVSKPVSQGANQTPTSQQPLQSLPGLNMAPIQPPAAGAPSSGAVSPSSHTATTTMPTDEPGIHTAFRSVTDAKKKAQEAILALWPLKVRYQDYIDEGLDEKLVRTLFTELGLEASKPKAVAAHKTAADLEGSAAPPDPLKTIPKPQNAKDDPPSTSNQSQATTAEPVASNGSVGGGKTAAEERKDKIARKLAAKAQKPAVAVQPSLPTPSSQLPPVKPNTVASTSVSPAKTKTRAENNAILHQKLAALKRAQEEKAVAEKKLTAEGAPKPATSPTVSTSDTVPNTGSEIRGESPKNLPVAPVSVPEPDRRSMSTEKSLPKEAGIPGLFLATPPTQPPPPTRSLKRPVAADFDNYPNPIGSLKRTRTQETLIIDVSDDEDVEMDIGSPTDEPNSSNGIIDAPPRQTPLGSFPPLSNSSNWKQRSSPSSSVAPTPPVHGAKLSLLHKRIEETKRLIAEAEAKKAAKGINTSQLPQAPPSAAESIELPKVSEASQEEEEAKKANVERRDRIVSYELPVIEATLREKQDKLKEIVAQAAQLQLEIQANMEKRQRLAAEATEPPNSPEQISAEIDMQAQPIHSDATPEPNDAIELQLAGDQQTNSEPVTDVPMAEEDTVELNHEPFVNGVQSSSPSSQTDFPAENQSLIDAQLSHDFPLINRESRTGTGDDKAQLQDASIDAAPSSNEFDLNMADASETHAEGEDLAKMGTLEQSSRNLSPSSDSSYGPQLTSPIHDVPFSEPKDETIEPQSPREQSHPLTDTQPVCEAPNNANSSQPIQESAAAAPETLSGEVQNSSSHEHPLLTSIQNEPEQKPQLEDILSYHSPLGYFRAYRFHPKYFDEVAGGLKSMTYSSKIDPMQPICPHVSSGEECPDGNACQFQHFENMVLPDAEIITQLGSADMFTGETRNKFIEGLKKVLNELKANKVKDFDRITRAIVKHRQEFLEDKSKVLPLDTSTG